MKVCEGRESKESLVLPTTFGFQWHTRDVAKALGQRSLVRHVPAEAPLVIGRSHKQGRGSVQSRRDALRSKEGLIAIGIPMIFGQDDI